jgi:hypothetical protein
LIDAGVDPEEKSKGGKTPLELLKNNKLAKDLLTRAVARKLEAAAENEL